MHHDRRAERAAVEQRLHLAIGRIEPPHETELNEAATPRQLRLDDLEAFLRALRQGLLAKHGFAGVDGGERERRMGFVGARDDDGIDVGAPDRGHGVGRDIAGAIGLGDLAGALRRGVAHHLQDRAGKILGNDPGMITAHKARADDRYADGHSKPLS